MAKDDWITIPMDINALKSRSRGREGHSKGEQLTETHGHSKNGWQGNIFAFFSITWEKAKMLQIGMDSLLD